MHKSLLVSAAIVLVCGGCASTPAPDAPPSNDKRVGDAVMAPLGDLNLVRAGIPPVLLAARLDAYAMPADRSCASLAAQVKALDAALGADLDTPSTKANPGMIERGGDAAVDALRNTTEGIVPFRGWVRKLTGAEGYAKDVAASIAAGVVRRAYLKGLGQASACAAPAAPRAMPVALPASAVAS